MSKKSNFGTQLAKGFVRSAVNQIGRDGGRVISNQIYKNKNYTPYMNISTVSQSGEDYDSKLDNNAVLIKPYSFGWKQFIIMILLLILSYPIPFVFGSVFLGYIIFSIILLNRKWIKIKRLETYSQDIPDRRYSCGYRTENHNKVVKYKLPANEDTIKEYRRSGKLMLLLTLGPVIIMGIISYIIYLFQ